MADGGHFGFMQINNKQNVFFCGSPSNIDNRSETDVHAKFDACITFVTIILLSNWTILCNLYLAMGPTSEIVQLLSGEYFIS